MKNTYKNFGTKIKEHRRIKHYSTQELAEKLNISVGLLNNIENARNDVFKLELLARLMLELDISSIELTHDKYINSGQIFLKSSEEVINVNITSKGLNHEIDLIKNFVYLIITSYLSSIAEFQYKKDAIEYIGNHIIQELEYLKNMKIISS